MGFTPLEGLMMGTRCGDIDPAIVPYLMRKEQMDAGAVDKFLNKECGLLGVSGVSADTRELAKHRANADVKLALEMFAYRARKYVGAYLAVLGGAQAVVFGGGIGENTAEIRADVCRGLTAFGIELDQRRNEQTIDCEGLISSAESKIAVWVIPTQEARFVAWLTANRTE